MAAHKAMTPFLLLCLQFKLGGAWNLPLPARTLAPHLSHQNSSQPDKRDGIQTEMSTCGYEDGDPKKSRTANSGFDCRVDTINGLWGFCPTTVIVATDCGLPGFCVDSHSCSSGCGNGENTQLTTFTCSSKDYCSFALLTFGVDQTYTYPGCGGAPTTVHYLVSPTSQATSTSKQSDPKTTQRPTTSTPTSTTPPSSTQPSTTSGSTGSSDSISSSGKNGSPTNNTGAIIGGVLGGIAILCIFGIAAIYLLRKNRSSRSRSPQVPAPLQSDNSFEAKDNESSNHHNGGWGPTELPDVQFERRTGPLVELPS